MCFMWYIWTNTLSFVTGWWDIDAHRTQIHTRYRCMIRRRMHERCRWHRFIGYRCTHDTDTWHRNAPETQMHTIWLMQMHTTQIHTTQIHTIVCVLCVCVCTDASDTENSSQRSVQERRVRHTSIRHRSTHDTDTHDRDRHLSKSTKMSC